MRTKKGRELGKSRGKKLGRPKGSRNKKGRIPAAYVSEIHKLLSLGIPIRSIARIINEKSGLKIAYSTYRNFVADDKKLTQVYLQNRNEKQNENEKQK